ARPAAVVPAGCWQAARPLGAYALVGCSVGPGFDMVDFELLADRAGEAAHLCCRFPDVAELIESLCGSRQTEKALPSVTFAKSAARTPPPPRTTAAALPIAG